MRELKNVVERAIALATGDLLSKETLPEHVREGRWVERESGAATSTGTELPTGVRLDDFLDDIRKRCIESALDETGGNQTRAADLLGVTFRALRYYVQKYGLSTDGRSRSATGGAGSKP